MVEARRLSAGPGNPASRPRPPRRGSLASMSAMVSEEWVQHGLRVGFAFIALMAALMFLSAPASAKSKPFDYCGQRNAVFHYRRPFMGIADYGVEFGTPGYRACSLGRMAAMGLGYFRAFLTWPYVELKPNFYDFGFFDNLVTDAANRNISVLPILLDAPKWRSTAPPTGAKPGSYPPAHPAQFAYFASLCVERYGPHGTFWQENPQVPYHPIHAWQIWNEENLPQNWEPRPNLAAYVRLLKAADVAIKRVDPQAIVVTGGLPFPRESDEAAVISRLYRSGARGYFDAFAIHDYSATVAAAMQRLWTARRVMNRFGGRKTPLWVTEMGWAGGDPHGFITNPLKQRQSVIRFFGLIQHARAQLGLREVFWYLWRDDVWGPGPRNWWGFNTGLFTTNLRPKPALAPLALAATRLDK